MDLKRLVSIIISLMAVTLMPVSAAKQLPQATIRFTAEPLEITPFITRKLTLYCSVEPFVSSTTDLASGKTGDKFPLVSLLSIVIKRKLNNSGKVVTIATNSYAQGVFSNYPTKDVDIEGSNMNNSKAGSITAFVKLVITEPTKSEAGEYVCSVAGTGDFPKPAEEAVNLVVKTVEINIDALAEYVKNAQETYDKLKQANEKQDESISVLTAKINRIMVQEGNIVVCKDSTTIKFKEPFKANPEVFISFNRIVHPYGVRNVSITAYAYYVSQLDRHGFTMKCQLIAVWAEYFQMLWLAILL